MKLAAGRYLIVLGLVLSVGALVACSDKPKADPAGEVGVGSPAEKPSPTVSETLEPLAEIQVTAFERKVEFEFIALPDTSYEVQIIGPDDVGTSREVITDENGAGSGTYKAKTSGTHRVVVVNTEGQIVAEVEVDVA